MSQFIQYASSPAGTIRIQANDLGVTHILFDEDKNDEQPNTHTQSAKQQLTEYFAGSRQTFDLPLAAHGTLFQRQVWRALLNIPFGKTVSYSDIANQIDKPAAVRAVGAANGKNPISIVVPCHRVVGKNGTLTGYAGGLDRKAILLKLEQEGINAS